MKPIFDTLTEIADRHLNIPTLQERRSDSLDFHDVSVWGVKDALWAAYQAGVNASSENPRLYQRQLTSTGMFHTPGLFRALQNDYRIRGTTRRRAIRIFSEGYGLSHEEAAGLLGGAITSEIDDAAGTITFTSRCEEPPAVADEALNAFWDIIVKRYPQAKTGDLSPGATIALQMAAENAVEEWVSSNVPARFRK